MPNANSDDDFVIAVTGDNIGGHRKEFQLGAGLAVDGNVCWPGAEAIPLRPQQQPRLGLNVVTRSRSAQQQQHTLRPTADEFVPQAIQMLDDQQGAAQDVNNGMAGQRTAALESPAGESMRLQRKAYSEPIENESVEVSLQACSG